MGQSRSPTTWRKNGAGRKALAAQTRDTPVQHAGTVLARVWSLRGRMDSDVSVPFIIKYNVVAMHNASHLDRSPTWLEWETAFSASTISNREKRRQPAAGQSLQHPLPQERPQRRPGPPAPRPPPLPAPALGEDRRTDESTASPREPSLPGAPRTRVRPCDTGNFCFIPSAIIPSALNAMSRFSSIVTILFSILVSYLLFLAPFLLQ